MIPVRAEREMSLRSMWRPKVAHVGDEFGGHYSVSDSQPHTPRTRYGQRAHRLAQRRGMNPVEQSICWECRARGCVFRTLWQLCQRRV